MFSLFVPFPPRWKDLALSRQRRSWRQWPKGWCGRGVAPGNIPSVPRASDALTAFSQHSLPLASTGQGWQRQPRGQVGLTSLVGSWPGKEIHCSRESSWSQPASQVTAFFRWMTFQEILLWAPKRGFLEPFPILAWSSQMGKQLWSFQLGELQPGPGRDRAALGAWRAFFGR